MKKILVIQTAFIGDAILATGLIESLALSAEPFLIDVLVRKGNENLFEANKRINQILIWDKKNGKYKSLINVSRQIRKNNYTIVINLQRFASSGFLVFRSGSKIKIGYKQNPFSFSFTHKLNHVIGDETHEVKRNLNLANTYFNLDFKKPKLYFTQEDIEAVNKVQMQQSFVTMSPASVWFTKQLPIKKWIELIGKLNNDLGIYLLGGSGDFELNENLKKNFTSNKNIINLAGKLSLKQSALLMQSAKMNYVNDSAPMHLASSVNAPTTAFFCSTVPSFGFGPLADDARIIEVKESLKCRPCGLHGHKSCPLKHFNCGNNIQINP